ncbi:MAG: ATP-binding cassette domain-containing protein [Patescibacteria group bacterium]|nr:ATP-binding cassette domain-containing protein [Patescibacteria group bacterium]
MKKEKEPLLNYNIVARDLSLIRVGKELIANSSFVINPGDKAVLIGRNGGGKTTLLQVIIAKAQGKSPPDGVEMSGTLEIGQEVRIGYLPQEIRIHFDGKVTDYLDACAGEIARVNKEYEELVNMLSQGESPELLERFGLVTERMNNLQCWDYPQIKEGLIRDLGLPTSYLERYVSEISGGERNKIAIAGVLISTPNFLVLDEPTNNLDNKAIEALIKWLKSNKRLSALIVSHNRSFIDEIADLILDIDEHDKSIHTFTGNYSSYSRRKKELIEAQERAYKEQQRRRKELQESAKTLKEKSQEFETTSTNAHYRARGAKLAQRAKTQLKRIEKELSSIEEPKPPRRPAFIVTGSQEKDKSLALSLNSISFSYQNGKEVFSNLSLQLKGGERMAIVGENGAGKTTLIKIITGNLTPITGQMFVTNKISYLPQDPAEIDLSQDVTDFFRQHVQISEEEARQILGKVLFEDVSRKTLGDLSIGSIRRVQIATLFARDPKLLVLDEPTNHLDIKTIEMLEEALQNFSGALIVVSHDEFFLRNVKPDKYLIFDKFQNPRLETSINI